MAIANVHFDEIFISKKNLLISSKSIKPDSLDTLLGDILKKRVGYFRNHKFTNIIVKSN
ncbi:colanic acid capsullar biosynthesis activation protein A [Salmonella enterica subsp. enterica]|nr:colanic acid capsullar biosynthesis activation protein A [Salmonella enterica subsp. enterica]